MKKEIKKYREKKRIEKIRSGDATPMSEADLVWLEVVAEKDKEIRLLREEIVQKDVLLKDLHILFERQVKRQQEKKESTEPDYKKPEDLFIDHI